MRRTDKDRLRQWISARHMPAVTKDREMVDRLCCTSCRRTVGRDRYRGGRMLSEYSPAHDFSRSGRHRFAVVQCSRSTPGNRHRTGHGREAARFHARLERAAADAGRSGLARCCSPAAILRLRWCPVAPFLVRCLVAQWGHRPASQSVLVPAAKCIPTRSRSSQGFWRRRESSRNRAALTPSLSHRNGRGWKGCRPLARLLSDWS